jgi:hypothetical protein
LRLQEKTSENDLSVEVRNKKVSVVLISYRISQKACHSNKVSGHWQEICLAERLFQEKKLDNGLENVVTKPRFYARSMSEYVVCKIVLPVFAFYCKY